MAIVRLQDAGRTQLSSGNLASATGQNATTPRKDVQIEAATARPADQMEPPLQQAPGALPRTQASNNVDGERVNMLGLLHSSNQGQKANYPGKTHKLGLPVGTGAGKAFGARQLEQYNKLKTDPHMAMGLYDLQTGEWLHFQEPFTKRRRGASVHKAFTMAAHYARYNGEPPASVVADITPMIQKSDNPSWVRLRGWRKDGTTNDAKNRSCVANFFRDQGYAKLDGTTCLPNRLGLKSVAKLYEDIYRGQLPGSEQMMEHLASCHTNKTRNGKYLPTDWKIGGKTGSFAETTWDTSVIHEPRTGRSYIVAAYHSVDRGNPNSENVAVAAGGMLQEYVLDKE